MLDAHLNGSVNMETPQKVFEALSDTLGPRLPRWPDGETRRKEWVNSLVPFLHEIKGLELVEHQRVEEVSYEFPIFTLSAGWSAQDLDLSPLRFAETALGGYQAFCRARAAGLVPKSARFQLSYRRQPLSWASSSTPRSSTI